MASHFSAFIHFRVPPLRVVSPPFLCLSLSLSLCHLLAVCWFAKKTFLGFKSERKYEFRCHTMRVYRCECVSVCFVCVCVRISVYMYVGNSRKLSQVRHTRRAASSFA